MNDGDAIDKFSHYLTDARHFSPYTARCYTADLRDFCEFLAESGLVAGAPSGLLCLASEVSVCEFVRQKSNSNCSPSHIARKLATLRSFYKWAASESLVSRNPTAGVSVPREAKQ